MGGKNKLQILIRTTFASPAAKGNERDRCKRLITYDTNALPAEEELGTDLADMMIRLSVIKTFGTPESVS